MITPRNPAKPPARLWHVTTVWNRAGRRLKKDILVGAVTKDEAIEMAKNRFHDWKDSESAKMHVRDLGTVQARRTYFSSDITEISSLGGDTLTPLDAAAFDYAIAWGSELGWRSTNQNMSEQDLAYLARLRNEPDVVHLLCGWAQEWLESGEPDSKAFFKQKLSDYLGTQVMDMEDMIPVSDSEYDRIMQKARADASTIVAEAKRSADTIRSEMRQETERLAEIARALTRQGFVPTMPAEQPSETPAETVIPDEPDNIPDFEQEPAQNEPEQDLPNEEPIEKPDDMPEDIPPEESETEDETPPKEDIPDGAAPDEPEAQLSADDFQDDFPDEDNDDSFGEDSYEEEIPEDELPDEEDFFPPEDELPEEEEPFDDDTALPQAPQEEPEAQAVQEPETQTTQTPDVQTDTQQESEITDEILINTLVAMKPEVLTSMLDELTVQIKNRRGKTLDTPAINALQSAEQRHLKTEEMSLFIVRCIICRCKPIHNKSALRYVYDILTADSDGDEAF